VVTTRLERVKHTQIQYTYNYNQLHVCDTAKKAVLNVSGGAGLSIGGHSA
jgi:hypothetical protein